MAADNHIHVAVVGCGYWGKNLVRNFAQLETLRWVCDVSEAALQAQAELYPHIQTTTQFEDVLADDNVQAVIIATPAETHYVNARAALMRGKDVLVEKPLAPTYEEGAHLLQLAEQHERILMVGHVLEYHPAVIELIKMVHQGTLGKIRYIYSNRLSLGKIRREENILWSFAPHDIAIILHLMGSMPFQVVACGGNYIQPNIADVTVTCLLFDNGVRAHIHVSWLHPFKEQRLVVIGSEKMASFDDVAKSLVIYDQRVEIKEGNPIPIKGNGEAIPFPSDEPLRQECKAFLDAIATRQQPVTDGPSGLRVLKVLQAAQRSLVMNGTPVDLPIEHFSKNRLI